MGEVLRLFGNPVSHARREIGTGSAIMGREKVCDKKSQSLWEDGKRLRWQILFIENEELVMITATEKPLAQGGSNNPYLSGIYTPISEEVEVTDLTVTGEIPETLNGSYLRIGPNPIDADPMLYNPFVGDGMLHGVGIADGRALWYRNRWIRSRHVAKVLGVDPAPGPRNGNDTVNTNVVAIAGKIHALVEAGSYPVVFSSDLREQAFENFGRTLAGAFSAHPHLDPLTGEQHAICYATRAPGDVRHVVVEHDGTVVREEPIDLPHGPMIHDCAITSRFVVILDLPVAFSRPVAETGNPFPYIWQPELQARIGLMPRNGTQSETIWCPIAPRYAFHVANAFDREDGAVVIDVCALTSMFAMAPDEDRSLGLERWIVDLQTGTVTIMTIDAAPQEFPRIDERRFGQHHRFVYTVSLPAVLSDPAPSDHFLYKHDLEKGSRETHDFGSGRFPGEFVFVPKSLDAGEAEGWLIGFVIDEVDDQTDLFILDAENFEGEPQAVVHLPFRVPPGFHGNWVNRNNAP